MANRKLVLWMVVAPRGDEYLQSRGKGTKCSGGGKREGVGGPLIFPSNVYNVMGQLQRNKYAIGGRFGRTGPVYNRYSIVPHNAI